MGGQLLVGGQDVLKMSTSQLADYRGKVASMIFQEPLLALDPVYSVGAQIVESIRRHESVSAEQAHKRALELFERVRIPSPERRLAAYPHEMSGGMRQRAMIALALACKPQLLLADEPTTALDATVQIQILLLLRELQREMGLSVIFVTHDIGAALEVADRIAVMYAGRIVEVGSARALIRTPRHPYTLALLKSRAHGALAKGSRLETIGGAPPDLSALPPGCAFAERCGYAADACRKTNPEVVMIAPRPRRALPAHRRHGRIAGHRRLKVLPCPWSTTRARAFMPYPETPVPQAGSGPLSGLSFAVKDLFDVAGYPTSGGQPFVLALSGIKQRTAPTVQKLLDAGARFVGKTITDELAFSMNGQNAHFGSPINGAAPERITGGSSSGSAAAVSNRLCDFALGTDTGGSVRAPANHCGLVGLRPTHGRISLQGVLDLSPSFDTCGWFTRDVHSFARVADVLLGEDAAPLPDTAAAAAAHRHLGAAAHRGDRGLRRALRRGRSRARPLPRPTTVVLDSLDAMYWHYRHVQGHEAWTVDGALIERYHPPLGPGVAQRFAWAREIPDQKVADGQAYRTRFRAHMAAAAGPRRRAADADHARHRAADQRRRGRAGELPQPRAADAVHRRPGRAAAAEPAAGHAAGRAAGPEPGRATGQRPQLGALAQRIAG